MESSLRRRVTPRLDESILQGMPGAESAMHRCRFLKKMTQNLFCSTWHNGCDVVLMCTELITKIAKMKSKHSADLHGWDDDDDEPSEWRILVNLTVVTMTICRCWLLGSTVSDFDTDAHRHCRVVSWDHCITPEWLRQMAHFHRSAGEGKLFS